MTNKKPFFSVLMPVYNVEDYVAEAIDSVIKQTFSDFELIIVDDGSTDNSGSICDEYAEKDKRISVYHTKNHGALSARILAISHSKGKYCSFIDSDDLFSVDLLASAYKKIIEENCDVVLFNLSFFNGRPKSGASSPSLFDCCEKVFLEGNKEPLYSLLLLSNRLNNLVTKVIATPLLKRDDTDFGAFTNPHGEDLLESFYPILMAKKIVYINKNLYYYRQRTASVSKTIPREPADYFNSFNTMLFEKRKEYNGKCGFPVSINDIYAFHFKDVLRFFFDGYRRYNRRQKKELLSLEWSSIFTRDALEALERNKIKTTFSMKIQINGIIHKRSLIVSVFSLLRCVKSKLKKR